ncbi:P27 family phage terminase small subunit [Pandoraea norimbergensis]
MPNPKKPPSLKAISGTSRPDRDSGVVVDLPLVSEYPEPPDWLPNQFAVKEWHRIVPILMANKLLTEASLAAVATYCATHGSLVREWAAGLTPTASMINTLNKYQNDFGLTAASQGKVKSIGETQAGNKFSNNGRLRKPA